MEWFLSGDTKCPPELSDWWEGQLNPIGYYCAGYTYQLRSFNGRYDQINALIDGIKNHPTSRRHILTTWNPEDMNSITEINQNEKTPTTCHNTVSQFFVRGRNLYLTTYQRSADLLLGVPHNWIQTWALFLWVASQTGYKAIAMQWNFGDLHIYTEESHVFVANAIAGAQQVPAHKELPELRYIGKGTFTTKDFKLFGPIPDPITTQRPTLIV
jgi:thymidylate synthase